MRSLTTKNLFEKRPYREIRLQDETLLGMIGRAECRGIWLVYGVEKNGKTAMALRLARRLAISEKVSYISAEEGLYGSFLAAVKRSGITTGDRIMWDEYLTPDEIIAKFKRQRSADVIIIDNLTMYADDLKPSELKTKLQKALPNKLLILVAHEEKRQPYPAIGRQASKLASVIFHVVGMKATVTSRYGAGGEYVIDEAVSEMYNGRVE